MFQVGEFKAHAAEWKANVRAELRETRRRLSVEVHDKLQRAATIRSMERRQLGLDQRAHSLDVLSPERRAAAAFNSLDGNHFKTSTESIDMKLNNLRLRAELGENHHHHRNSVSVTDQACSEDNIFNRLSSVTRLARRSRNRASSELKKNITDEARRSCEAYSCSSPSASEGKGKEDEEPEEDADKECNTSLTNVSVFAESPKPQNGFVMLQTKEKESEKEAAKEVHLQMDP